MALDMNTEWEAVAGSKLVTGVLVVRKDAAARDPEAFQAFWTAYAASVGRRQHRSGGHRSSV